mmetsp:Transcript_81969/g.211218  ORF Transcript_81969/g.211218 Transcript_81969/m.211218 type:complete len:448 (-) Transcript_81969:386-1729(-)
MHGIRAAAYAACWLTAAAAASAPSSQEAGNTTELVSAGRKLRGTCTPNYSVNCVNNPNCCDPASTCFAKDNYFAACLRSCEPGIRENDPPQFRTPWTCNRVGQGAAPAPPGQAPAPPAPPSPAPAGCAKSYVQNCKSNGVCCDPTTKCYAKGHAVAVCLHSCAPGIHMNDPPQHRTPWSCKLVPPGLPPSPVLPPSPALPPPRPPAPSPALGKPSNGDLMEFYMYRSQSDANYTLQNVNAANLVGAMWYLQNEVVSGVYGSTDKFGISRILRLKVQVKATQPLLEKGMNFGVRVAFDSGKCTGPDCEMDFSNYGYNVGCNNLGDWPFPEYETYYPGGIWYSLPGVCPSASYLNKTLECIKAEPGGRCAGTPTGAGDCTWSYEEAGQITLEELYASAGVASEPEFWADRYNPVANSRKVKIAQDLFAAKYGEDPPTPPCDFNFAAIYR